MKKIRKIIFSKQCEIYVAEKPPKLGRGSKEKSL